MLKPAERGFFVGYFKKVPADVKALMIGFVVFFIAGMASASDADLAKMVENYAALKEAQDTTSESIADLKTGMSNSMDEIAKTVADTVSEMDMSDEATKSAKETIQGFIDGASSMMPRVQEAYAKIASAASTALAGSNERYNVNHGIPGYAVGTEDAAPGFALVGEHGPELVYFDGLGNQTGDGERKRYPHER